MKEGGQYVAANGDFQLAHDVDTEDSKDSDALQLFELPKRKLVRPISHALRRKVRPSNQCWSTTKDCCRIFVTVTLPMLIAVFIVSTILCLTFLLVGIAGMKQEISMLKIRLKNVDAAEENFIGKKEGLRKEFQEKLNNVLSYQTELNKLQYSVKHLSARLNTLNHSMVLLTSHNPTLKISSTIESYKQDIATLKTGMADTGADIETLKAAGKSVKKGLHNLKGQMKKANLKIYNLSVQISVIENKPAPQMTTTPKTLVVTLTPDEDKPVSRKQLKAIIATSEKKQSDACKKEVLAYNNQIDGLRNMTQYMNQTYSSEMIHFRKFITDFYNKSASTKVGSGAEVSDTANNDTGKYVAPQAMSPSVSPLPQGVKTNQTQPTRKATHAINNVNKKSIQSPATKSSGVRPTAASTTATAAEMSHSGKASNSTSHISKMKRVYADMKADEVEHYKSAKTVAQSADAHKVLSGVDKSTHNDSSSVT